MSTAIKKVVVESGVSFTAHDLRRTAATVAAEHGFSRDQIGRLLNHSVSNVTEAYIQKTAVALMPILEAIEQDILGA
jgi:integrase